MKLKFKSLKKLTFDLVGIVGFEPTKTYKSHTWYTMCRFVHTLVLLPSSPLVNPKCVGVGGFEPPKTL